MRRELGDVAVQLTAAAAAASAVRALARPTRRDGAWKSSRSARDRCRTAHPPRTRHALLPIAASLLVLAIPGVAQTVHYGVVMDQPRRALESLWTDDAQQLERAYCIVNFSSAVMHVSRAEPVQVDTLFRVWTIQPAQANSAGPSSVDFECPSGVPELHTHTPTTCMGDDVRTCVVGGLNAYSCQPSREDLEKLVRRGDPFAVIQCDQRDFRFYYPTEYVPPTIVQVARGPAAAATRRNTSKPDANVPLAMQPVGKSKRP